MRQLRGRFKSRIAPMSDLPSPIKSLKGALEIFAKDLESTPDRAFHESLGGKARTVSDIAHEVCLVNDHVCRTMTGEPLFDWPEGWVKAPAELTTKEAAIAAFALCQSKTLATVEGWSDEDLAIKVQSEFGERDRAESCRFMALHLWYHSGQINFIQTLLGDDHWHW